MGGAKQHQVLMPMFVLAGWLFFGFIQWAVHLYTVGILKDEEHLEGWNYWYFGLALIMSIAIGVFYDRSKSIHFLFLAFTHSL